MVERDSNTLLIYPVSDRSEDTLIPIIKNHVEAGSTIYSDGWSAYCGLNELGYNHFTVLHKYSFKKVYINQNTREEVEIHTNRIEGAWKHAKEHFRRMSGTKISQFEGHLCEIMWRAETKSHIYQSFFQSLSNIYTLSGPPVYTYPTPIFPTWSGLDSTAQLGDWEIKPGKLISYILIMKFLFSKMFPNFIFAIFFKAIHMRRQTRKQKLKDLHHLFSLLLRQSP